MNAIKLLESLDERGIKYWTENDKLSIRSPKGVMTPELREQLAKHKEAILELIRNDSSLDSPTNDLNCENDLSLATIGRLIGGFDEDADSTECNNRMPIIDQNKMARSLKVTFRPLPNRYDNKTVIDFRKSLKSKLLELGVTIDSWQGATKDYYYEIKLPFTSWKPRISYRVIKSDVDAVFDVERPSSIRTISETFFAEKIYQIYQRLPFTSGRGKSKSIASIAMLIGWAEDKVAKFVENPTNTQVITINAIDDTFVADDTKYQDKINIGINTLIRTFSEIVIGVSDSRISILNMNLSDSVYEKIEFDSFVLKSLVPKIFVPIAPISMDQLDINYYKPKESTSAQNLVKLGRNISSTGLLPEGFKLSNTIERESYRDIVDIIVNGRTGVSYGFVAYIEPPRYFGDIEIASVQWDELKSVTGFSNSQIRQNKEGRLYIRLKSNLDYVYKQIPDIWISSSRSGANKTDLNLDTDVLRIGLSRKLLLQFPEGADIVSMDIRPSYDIYVMVSIALAASLYAPCLVENGAPIVHFHGYPSSKWFQSSESYYGNLNPSVPCGTYESGIFNFLSVQKIFSLLDTNPKLIALIEPDHGTNVIASSLPYLVERLYQGCANGEIELGGKHFRTLDNLPI